MKHDWQSLTEMTKGKEIVLERIRVTESGIRIEGEFELPPLAKLPLEDQIFVASFIKSHGSIKEMEKLFGVSYPTIKNRLNRISEHFDFIEVTARSSAKDILEELEKGNISVEEAMEELKK